MLKKGRRFLSMGAILINGLISVTLAAKTSNRTLLIPELLFRQAQLSISEDSVWHEDTDKDYNHQIYLSLKMLRTYDYVHEVVIEPAIRTVRENPNNLEFVIDQGYIKSTLGAIHLTAGKKLQYSGAALFVNPSDLLNQDKDLFDPYYQRAGKYLTQIGRSWGDWDLKLAYLPAAGRKAHFGKIYTQVAANFSIMDIEFQHTYNREELSTFGYALTGFLWERVNLYVDGRFQQKTRPVDERQENVIFDCDKATAVDPNFICRDRQSSGFFNVVGLRFVMSRRRSLVLESIQDQLGLNKEDKEDYYRLMKINLDQGSGLKDNPPDRIIGRQYIFSSVRDEQTIKHAGLSLSVLHSLDDQSGFAAPEFRYFLSPVTQLSLQPTIFYGDKLTEFGEMPFKQVVYIYFRGVF